MNIKDFKYFAPLDQLHKKMGVTEQDQAVLETAGEWHTLTADEIRRLGSVGIDVDIDVVEYADDGSFEYKGQKVIIYIRDQLYYEKRPWRYKYHICSCKKIREMKDGGRFHRYVVSNRMDGKFIVTKLDPQSREPIPGKEKIEEVLDVCKLCLNEMLAHHPAEQTLFTFKTFTLKDFLGRFATQHTSIPAHTDGSAPVNTYTMDWDKISKQARSEAKWKCSSPDCPHKGVSFEKRKNLLHVHHKDGNKANNNPSNLMVLCVDCHKRQPFHNHM